MIRSRHLLPRVTTFSATSHPRARRGFALVAVLIVLVLVTVMVVGYLSIVRTERSASQNFNDHSSTESMAMGVLNRLMAEHAVPKINGKPLAPYVVDGTSANPTGLPTAETVNNYFGTQGSLQASARKALAPIYEFVPDDDTVFENIGLVTVSKPSTGGTSTPAYDSDFWSYDGITNEVLAAPVTNPPQPPANMVPQWVDYYEDDPSTGKKKAYPTARIAYAIWDEGGKLDVNMSGSDGIINGMAPHNLQIESAVTSGTAQMQSLLDYLNNSDPGDGLRERSNFSLRRIATSGSNSNLNDTGDDRWVFSVRELVEKKLVDPNKLRQVTTFSRDFDVRPEWDGDRASQFLRQAENRFQQFGAEDFLRSYINNPDLFDLFYNASRNVDPQLIVGTTLNQSLLQAQLQTAVPGVSGAVQQNWMQIMRFLAILRRAFPGINTQPAGYSNVPLNQWSNYDVWGAALNATQAVAPAADHNLFAAKTHLAGTQTSNGWTDPDSREGMRISPYVTAMSVKLKRIAATTSGTQATPVFTATEYITVWNPYPFPITETDGVTPIYYQVGSYTTGATDDEMSTVDNAGGYLPGPPLAPVKTTWPWQNVAVSLHMPSPNSSGAPSPLQTSDSWVNMARAIPPGQFAYIRLPARYITPNMLQEQLKDQKTQAPITFGATADGVGKILDSNTDPGLFVTQRTYIRNPEYYGLWDFGLGNVPAGNNAETVFYSVNMTTPYWDLDTSQDTSQTGSQASHTWVYIPPSQFPKSIGTVTWFSFQIDDPRCGCFPRFVPPNTPAGKSFVQSTFVAQTGTNYQYSWWSYPGTTSIDYPTLAKWYPDESQADFKAASSKSFNITINGTSQSVAGFNQNFGINWPGADPVKGIASGDQTNFDLMMSTFGLPGRPFLNVGELGNVWAERPWTTIGFANSISPLNKAITVQADDYSSSGPDAGNPPARPAALLDYFTTIGTPTAAPNLNYRAPNKNSAVPSPTSIAANVNQRYQEKAWLFDSVTGTNDMTSQSAELPTGNLRPIRGRINLNTASYSALVTLLRAPYRMPASIGLWDVAKGLNWTVTPVDKTQQSDLWVTIDDGLVNQFATMLSLPVTDPASIRPLRNMCDLSRLFDQNSATMTTIYKKYPSSILNAIFGRLAQFGTVRSQIYTIDLAVRELSPQVEQKRLANPSIKSAIKSEVRVQALVYFDTFSRKSYIESIQYR